MAANRFKESPRGPIQDRVSFGETDNETRGNRDKKASITILPARRTVINVYQLFNKLTKGGKKEKPMGRPVTNPETKRRKEERTASSKKSKTEEPKEFVRKSTTHFYDPDEYVTTIDNERINTFGLPFKKEGETPSQYNVRANAFVQEQRIKGNPDYKHFKFEETTYKTVGKEKKPVSEHEAPVNMKGNINAAQKQAASKRQEITYDETTDTGKLNTLKKLTKDLKIPVQKNVVTSPAYGERSPLDDYDRIKRAISIAAQEGKIGGPNSAIIAVSPTPNNPSIPPKYYFVRNDLSYRRKKMIRPTLKRKPIAGKKRKVVIKKKGGKR